MAADNVTKYMLRHEWDEVRKPILEKLNAMHADITLTCGDVSTTQSIADAYNNIERLTQAKEDK